MLKFVQFSIEHLLSTSVASICNPKFRASSPKAYPLLDRIMLTYPLTWRDQDKAVFVEMFSQAVQALHLQSAHKDGVIIELVCSEPTAVAAYLIWELIFQFGTGSMPLLNATLGNVKNDPELRLLIVDIGGGSADIAVIDVDFAVPVKDQVDVSFKMVESMRFNRAGDRLTHLLITKIWHYIRTKYGITESLSFQEEDNRLNLTKRRSTVSILAAIAEHAKVSLSQGGTSWTISVEQETSLLAEGQLSDLIEGSPEELAGRGRRLQITEAEFESWVRKDFQSIKTGGEPGFMDIFLFLEELQNHLSEYDRKPHMVVLSGRTCRMALIKRLVMEHMKMPSHRVRELRELLPVSTELNDAANIDKLAVAAGAHRFRFGDNVRFTAVPEVKTFNRYIGTVRDTPDGLRLHEVFVRPGEAPPLSKHLKIAPSMDLRIGHCFREAGIVEVVAVISNNSRTETHEVTIDIEDDYSVKMLDHLDLVLAEWVPGGNDIIVDNFYDTGEIDQSPRNFILSEVLQEVRLK